MPLPLLALLAVALAVGSGNAGARTYALGDLSIHAPWSRALPAVAPNGAAYFRIENHGREADRIVSAASAIADRVELHTHEMDGGVMKMRHVHSVEVPAHGAVPFKPGGLHVMLIGLRQPLVADESFPLTLVFEKAGSVEVTVEVTADGPTGHASHGSHASHGDHGSHQQGRTQ